MEYDFTLKYQIVEDDGPVEKLIDRLGEAGCHDALIGSGQPGRLALAFTREGGNAKAAIRSALADVKRAIPSARLIEAGPDLVGLSDVAALVGVTRQNMRKLMLTHRGSFPAPVHESSVAIWHLADLLTWLAGKGGYPVDQSTLDIALAAWEINTAKEAIRISAGTARELRQLVA